MDPRSPSSSNSPATRVLVIDDDPLMARAVQRVLCRAGYETLTACDGLVARSLVYHFKPQLVVLDLCMPNIDGIALTALLTELAETTPSLACKLLVVSGAEQERLDLARHLGAHDALSKPFTNEMLLDRVGGLLAEPIT